LKNHSQGKDFSFVWNRLGSNRSYWNDPLERDANLFANDQINDLDVVMVDCIRQTFGA
jgi:hypothetical protein